MELRDCPNGHGPMAFYEGAKDDDPDDPMPDEPDFFECVTCGHKEDE